jgi:hypothetical protein
MCYVQAKEQRIICCDHPKTKATPHFRDRHRALAWGTSTQKTSLFSAKTGHGLRSLNLTHTYCVSILMLIVYISLFGFLIDDKIPLKRLSTSISFCLIPFHRIKILNGR